MSHSTKLIVPVLISLGLLLGPAFTAQVHAREDAIPETSRLTVSFHEGTTGQRMAELHRRAGVTVVDMIPELDTYIVDTGTGSKWFRSFVYRLSSEVEYVEDDFTATVADSPDDPYYDATRQWGLFQIGAEGAWDVTHSSPGIRIAVLDTGIDSSHPDLAAKVVAAKDFTGSGTPEPYSNSHGTHVAGIAAAVTDNATGVAGLAWDASLMNAKVMNDSGTGYYSWIASGIIWAVDNGADVINMSLSGSSGSSVLSDAIDYAWANGVLLVAAAGNDGSSSPRYPAAYDNVISVAASLSTEGLASWSNYGASWVDVSAPSWAYSTKIGGYTSMQGTSMACPVVAGLAGLVFDVTSDSNGNGLTNDEVRLAIESTCIDTGTDVRYGRIDATAAVGNSPPPTTGQVTGTVIDAATSTAVQGATVSDGSRTHVTDSQGVYLLSGMPAGTYTVTVSADGCLPASRQVEVAAGATSTADFALALEAAPNSPPAMDPIGDKSIDEDQLLRFSVTADDPDGDPLVFTASGLPAGAAFSDQSFSWVPVDGQDGAYDVTFTVSDEEDTDSETVTITVNAIVRYGAISGAVVDSSTGQPVSAATVSAGETSLTTDADGSYVFTDVPEGSHLVTLAADDYLSQEREAVVEAGETVSMDFFLEPMPNESPVLEAIGDKTVDEGGLLEFEVTASDPEGDTLAYAVSELPDGAAFDSRVFSWAPGFQAAGSYVVVFSVSDGELQDAESITITVVDVPTTGTISGQITDSATGLPVAGASVTTGELTTRTDTEGSFSLAAVPEGSCNLVASAQSYEDISVEMSVLPCETTSVTLQMTALPEGGAVYGIVTDWLTGEPVERATVELHKTATCLSDASGVYEFTGLAAGEYKLTVSLKRYAPFKQSLVFEQDTSIDLDIQLIPVAVHHAG